MLREMSGAENRWRARGQTACVVKSRVAIKVLISDAVKPTSSGAAAWLLETTVRTLSRRHKASTARVYPD